VQHTEAYSVPMGFPRPNTCVNCGGERRPAGGNLIRGAADDPSLLACTVCGTSAKADRELHERLAQLHPKGQFLRTSVALAKAGRTVLALKLATAEIHLGPDPVAGMTARVELLVDLGLVDQAIDECGTWVDMKGSPPDALAAMAGIEAAIGDVPGAMRQLERALARDPRPVWWADYAELMAMQDERPDALRAAAKGVSSPNTEQRCVDVMIEVAERFFASNMFAEALAACSLAGDLQEQYVGLAWLRAQIAATNKDEDYLVRWLRATLAIEPGHAAAAAMLAPFEEPKQKARKAGWFW
jgi:hypothetical protein